MRFLTRLSGDLDEGLNATLSIVSLRGECGHIVPAHCSDDVQHGLSLIRVWGNHAGEEVIARVVAKLWSCRGVADLRNLWRYEGGYLLTSNHLNCATTGTVLVPRLTYQVIISLLQIVSILLYMSAIK